MITLENKNFTSSVNVKFDIGKQEYFNRYLPTPSHADAILGMLKGFNNSDTRHAHIVVGPYGTGKSLLGTILGGLASKNINSTAYNILTNKFKNVDDNIFQELEKVRETEYKYLPIILNGNEGSFRQAIISAITRTINEHNIDITVPGLVSNILATVDLWENEYPKTFKTFKKILSESNKDLELWRLNIQTQDNEEITWFKEVFPSLSSGAQFHVDYNDDFIEQVKHVLDELNDRKIGLFIIYDEFGRFLQSLGSSEINRTMQDLQDLAELSDHYLGSLHLLFITHKNLRQYFLKFEEEYQNEFQRIEKRFQLYHINSDSNTFIRLTDSVVSSLQIKEETLVDVNECKTMLRKYPLFPSLNQVEIEELVIKGCYPIHPVTLFLLPKLSNLLAQNERTLFTFLESNDKGGLLEHLRFSNEYYLPSSLFEFFFINQSEIDLNQDSMSVLDLYNRLSRSVPVLSVENSNSLPDLIVKFITLWNVSGLQSTIKLTDEFLSFALSVKPEFLDEALKQLTNYKAIRFNRIQGYWELYEGSAIDVDSYITKKMQETALSRHEKVTVLEENSYKKYYLSNDYNDQKSMTRFAAVNYVLSGDIINGKFDSVSIRENKNADALLNYVVLEDSIHLHEIKSILEKWEDKQSIFCIPSSQFKNIDASLLSFRIVESLLSDEEFLKQDSKLIEELHLKKEDISYEIQNYINVFTSFDNGLTWINGELDNHKRIKNSIVFERFLSSLMFKIYPLTPEVRNDSFNRRKINGIQKRAGFKVIDNIINHPYEDDIGIEGNGPDYLIYATLIKNNGLNLKSLDNVSSTELASLRMDLLNYIEKNPVSRFDNLTTIMSSAPYGIRKPLIPIILVALLRDKWDQIMFYRNDMYVSGIDGETLYEIEENAIDYEYRYYNYDDSYNAFFDRLSDTFGDYAHEQSLSKPKPIMLSSAFLSWLRGLPRYVQITSNLEENLLSFKELVRKSEVNPQYFIDSLYQQFGNDLDVLLEYKNELESSMEKHISEVKDFVLSTLGKKSYKELVDWAEQHDSYNKKTNPLLKSLLQLKENKWIEDLAFKLVGVSIYEWSDTTNNMFKQQLQIEINKIYENDLNMDHIELSINGVQKVITKGSLSTKSETIYNNVKRMINNAGRNVPKNEIENIVFKLLEEFVE